MLVAGAGLRQRMLLELVLGVAVGVLVGELLILAIGRGAWQLALVVVLATASALFAGLRGVALTQAANSGVLMAAVVPAVGADRPGGDPVPRRPGGRSVRAGDGAAAAAQRHPRPRPARSGRCSPSWRGSSTRWPRRCAPATRAPRRRRWPGRVACRSGSPPRQNTAANVAEVAAMSPVRWRQRPEVGAVRRRPGRHRQRDPRRPGAGPPALLDAADGGAVLAVDDRLGGGAGPRRTDLRVRLRRRPGAGLRTPRRSWSRRCGSRWSR